jgi:hypothetical protein
LAAPRARWTDFLRATGTDRTTSGPTSARLEKNLRDYDVRGEKAIAIAQGAICCFILLLHFAVRLKSGMGAMHSWLVLALGLLIASSAARWVLAQSKTLP